MTPLDQTGHNTGRKWLLRAFAGFSLLFLVLLIITSLVPDEPSFEITGFQDCKNDWFKRELNRRIRGETIYDLNPYGGYVQHGVLVCVAFPRTSSGVHALTYNFEWTDRKAGKWELKFF